MVNERVERINFKFNSQGVILFNKGFIYVVV